MKLLLLTLLLASCTKGNEPKGKAIDLLNDRSKLYCKLSEPYYQKHKKVEGSTWTYLNISTTGLPNITNATQCIDSSRAANSDTISFSSFSFWYYVDE